MAVVFYRMQLVNKLHKTSPLPGKLLPPPLYPNPIFSDLVFGGVIDFIHFGYFSWSPFIFSIGYQFY